MPWRRREELLKHSGVNSVLTFWKSLQNDRQKSADFKQDHTPDAKLDGRRSRTETYRGDFQVAYLQWKKVLLTGDKAPNQKQRQVLDLVHDRCIHELNEGQGQCVNASSGPSHWEPICRLVHGLPGSGKSQLLKWIRNYFEVVWERENGVHFVFLAPLNSMATGVSGQTLHSWGGIAFKKVWIKRRFRSGSKRHGATSSRCMLSAVVFAICSLMSASAWLQQHSQIWRPAC